MTDHLKTEQDIQTKQVIVLRKDLNMRKGKMIAQGAHASMGAVLSLMQKEPGRLTLVLDDPALKHWMEVRFKKIAVSVNSEAELLALAEEVKARRLPHCLIQDSGLTEFGGTPTYTALAIGPAFDEAFEGLTSHLPLL